MISYGTTATGGALVEDIGNNWTRIIPQDGSPEYYWNTTTNIRQWESPLTDIYSAGLGAVAQPGYGGYGGEVLGQHAGYIQQQHFQQQQQYTPKDQQPPRRQPPPQQQRAPAQTAGHGGAARQPAPSRAAEWAKQQSAGGNIDPLSIFVRNLDPKATSEEIRDFFTRKAVEYNINIITGTMPLYQENRLYNVGYLCRRDGTWDSQYKIHITPSEEDDWGMVGGNELKVFDTDCGKVAILICYDVEFPELSRHLVDQGMQWLLSRTLSAQKRNEQHIGLVRASHTCVSQRSNLYSF